MQPKKSAASKKVSGDAASQSAEDGSQPAPTQSRVGRPPTSSLDRKSQVRENVRVHRAKLKASGLEKVETYLPKAWQQFLQKSGESIQQLGLEAFALLLEKRGASDLVAAAQANTEPSENPP